MKKTIYLPKYVFEDGLYELINTLGEGNSADEIELDFEKIKFWIPAGIVALLTKIKYWEKNGLKVSLVNVEKSNAFRYLQRINLFNFCDVQIGEDFTRHTPNGRFVPITGIGYKENGYTSKTSEIACKVADCLAPYESKYYDSIDTEDYDGTKTGLYDFLEYSVSELARNVLNHSRSNGFAQSQYMENRDFVRLAISDFGIGIKESFQYTEYQDLINDDNDAINKALEAEISSAVSKTSFGYSSNAGMGLTFLKLLTKKLNGSFIVVSGRGFVTLNSNRYIEQNNTFNGTLCALRFKRSKLSSFKNLLEEIKRDLGIQKINLQSNFQ